MISLSLSPVDPIGSLKEEHRRFGKLFRELESFSEDLPIIRNEIFNELKTNLLRHVFVEESIFFPSIKNAGPTHEIVLESYEENKIIKELVKQLDKEDKTNEKWTAKLVVLRENLEMHVREEEKKMFKEAEKLLSADQKSRLWELICRTREAYLVN